MHLLINKCINREEQKIMMANVCIDLNSSNKKSDANLHFFSVDNILTNSNLKFQLDASARKSWAEKPCKKYEKYHGGIL